MLLVVFTDGLHGTFYCQVNLDRLEDDFWIPGSLSQGHKTCAKLENFYLNICNRSIGYQRHISKFPPITIKSKSPVDDTPCRFQPDQ